jgi:hypothetical protein
VPDVDCTDVGPTGQPLTSTSVIKGKAPVSNEVLKVKLPKREADLANGIT